VTIGTAERIAYTSRPTYTRQQHAASFDVLRSHLYVPLPVAGITSYAIFVTMDVYRVIMDYLGASAAAAAHADDKLKPGNLPRKVAPLTTKRLVLIGVRLGVVIAITIYACMVRVAMGGKAPKFEKRDSHLYYIEPPLSKALTRAYVWAYNFFLLIVPYDLCADYSFKAFDEIHTFDDWHNALTLSTIAFLLVCFLYLFATLFKLLRLNAELCAHLYHGLVWLLVPFIPASGVFVMVGFVLAERSRNHCNMPQPTSTARRKHLNAWCSTVHRSVATQHDTLQHSMRHAETQCSRLQPAAQHRGTRTMQPTRYNTEPQEQSVATRRVRLRTRPAAI
jgi:hypothetical protein